MAISDDKAPIEQQKHEDNKEDVDSDSNSEHGQEQLNAATGGKQNLRKNAVSFEDALDTDSLPVDAEGETATEAVNDANTAQEEPAKKKKKKKNKKNKSKGKRKNPPPTGFEETFAEPPLTLEQHEADQELYSPSKPFAERIELCIQRYKAKRKFDSWRNQLFESYLTLGGISSGQNKFSGGLDIKANDNRNAEEIAKFTATDYVDSKLGNVGLNHAEIAGLEDYDEKEPEYVVDFDYIVRGFLSYKVPFIICATSTEELEVAVKTIRNFLNFVMYHNVCPEFSDSVKEALKTCDLAAKELPLCRLMSTKFPGAFNKACSTLFGGYYKHLVRHGVWDEGSDDGLKPKLDERVLLGNTEEHAAKVFGYCISQIGSELQISKGRDVKVNYMEHISVRVDSLGFPPEGSKSDALGKLHVSLWTPEGELPVESKWTDTAGFELFLEKQVLQYCFVGMCFQCTIHELDTGIIYFDQVTGVMASFYVEMKDEKEVEVDSSDFDFD